MINLFSKKQNGVHRSSAAAPQTEEAYYQKLFVENAEWNKATPNAEETLRWQIIEKFLYYIEGYRKSLNLIAEHQILDVGCGRGWLSNLLSNYGKVLGIEPVEPVVAFANKLFPGLTIEAGTTTDLLNKKQHEKFDLVVCSEVIEHIPDNDKTTFIKDLKHLIKKNGFLIITTPRKEAQSEWMQYSSPGQPIEDWLDEATVRQMVIEQNFEEHLLKRFSISPKAAAPEVEIYQLWLFQRK